ncbi:Protein hipA [hydrothermal vent metagenome]|uniref:Protein hipA n=1 Tax=hydrothermal vent metagenome TaxID=652676 RepID=A0A1W1C1X1_9ZZZZ
MNKLNKNEEIVLEYISKKNTVIVSEVVLNTSIALRTAQRTLKKLADKNLIEVLGSTKDRSYKRVFNANDSTINLFVFSSGVLVGELRYGNGEYVFEYDDTYKGEEFENISKAKINTSVELFSYFENLIPEYDRRDRLLISKEDIADVLIGLNNSHGALDFIPKYKLFEYKPRYGKRKNWISVKQTILSTNSFPNLLSAKVDLADDILNATANSEHSDLSGYQTKIDINFDKDENIIRESYEAEYLLKPRSLNESLYFNSDEDETKRYYPYIAINEHLFMSFAKNELGFDVPYSGILKAKDRDYHYITKRYDRQEGLKYNQVDFAQVMGVKSSDKYRSSSEDLFHAINNKLSSKEAKLEALKFYYYSYLIKHADLHLKNIGALEIGNKKYILAPLYDLISVGVYNGESSDLGLGMSKPSKKPKNWKMEDFYKLGTIVGISKLRFKKEARAITKTFLIKMPKYIRTLKEFERTNPLPIQKTRADSTIDFSAKLENMFKEKVIQLNKLGIISELELLDESGGLLSAHKSNKSK